MKTSEKGIAAIELMEGFKPELYQDGPGHQTIGFGHRVVASDPYGPNAYISVEEGRLLLQSDLSKFEAVIEKLVAGVIMQYEFDALCSFCYNVGAAAFASSTLLRRLNAGEPREDVADELGRWVFITVDGRHVESPGLHHRRQAEYDMFLYDLYPQDVSEGDPNVANDDSSERQPKASARSQGEGQAGAGSKARRGKG